MNWKKILLFSGIGYIGYRLMQTSNTVNQLRYFLRKVKYNKSNSTFLRTALVVTIAVENPTRNSVRFNQFVGSISLKGTTISTLQVTGDDRPITFKTGTTDMDIDAIINHGTVLKLLPGLIAQITTGNFSELVTVTGTLYAGNLTIPINQSINLSF